MIREKIKVAIVTCKSTKNKLKEDRIKTCGLLMLILFIVLCSCSAGSEMPESPAEDFTYEMANAEVTITGYTGTDFEIRIPAMINDRPVTVIGKEAFKEYDMTKLYIPECVKVIEPYGFYNGVCVTEIILNEGLQTIGSYAFSGCEALEFIDIPETVNVLAERGIFSDCFRLKEVNLPANLMQIGEEAFENCAALEKIDLPTSLTAVESGAFCNCEALTEIILPDNLETLGTAAFMGCTSLEEIVIPKNTSVVERYETQVFIGASMPTATCSQRLGESAGANAQRYDNVVMIVFDSSVALHELQAVETEFSVDLQELGIYTIG